MSSNSIAKSAPMLSLVCAFAAGRAAAADDTPMLPPLPEIQTAGSAGGSVAPFVLDRSSEAGQRATECLTQAIYYEAATEDRGGQEAVAQVVLNRVRHPSYPKSVCGVVYQGVGSGVSCQFSFACDGSMNRAPVARLWRSAEEVANAALDGHVAIAAGASTHYHAGWANPYWRSSLVETGRIGTQIFYHMSGRLGSAQALTANYSGVETVAAPRVAPRIQAHNSVHRVAPLNTSAEFSPWGLTVATVSADHGAIKVKTST